MTKPKAKPAEKAKPPAKVEAPARDSVKLATNEDGKATFHGGADLAQLASGTKDSDFATKLISDVANSISLGSVSGYENGHEIAVKATLHAMKAFEPTDPIEGMLAAQAVALHSASLACLQRASKNQTPDVASKLRKDAANLARAMTDMIEALDRKRGKGGQHIRVERVTVHEGAQAIIGNVQGAGGRGQG